MAAESVIPPRAMRPREVVVTEIVPEAQGAVTIKMQPLEDAEYLAGQFISVDPKQFPELARWIAHLEKLKGRREPRRSYSLSSAPYEEGIAVTVKAEAYDPEHDLYPPLLSPFLVDHLRPGRRLSIMGYSGRYCLEGYVPEDVNTVVHVCAGSGVVPNMGIIKQDLRHGRRRHVLLCSNKTHDDILFLGQLEDLHHQFPERLSIVHALTRESNPEAYGPQFRPGRITEALVREAVANPLAVSFYVCGPAIGPRERRAARKEGRTLPNRFMESMLDLLQSLGIQEDRINKESWG